MLASLIGWWQNYKTRSKSLVQPYEQGTLSISKKRVLVSAFLLRKTISTFFAVDLRGVGLQHGGKKGSEKRKNKKGRRKGGRDRMSRMKSMSRMSRMDRMNDTRNERLNELKRRKGE